MTFLIKFGEICGVLLYWPQWNQNFPWQHCTAKFPGESIRSFCDLTWNRCSTALQRCVPGRERVHSPFMLHSTRHSTKHKALPGWHWIGASLWHIPATQLSPLSAGCAAHLPSHKQDTALNRFPFNLIKHWGELQDNLSLNFASAGNCNTKNENYQSATVTQKWVPTFWYPKAIK